MIPHVAKPPFPLGLVTIITALASACAIVAEWLVRMALTHASVAVGCGLIAFCVVKALKKTSVK